MSADYIKEYDYGDPTYYHDYFGYSREHAERESDEFDENIGEYIQTKGVEFDVYLCSKFAPNNIFGEDPLKEYNLPPFIANGIWEVTPETLKFGQHEIVKEDEQVVINFHKNTVKTSIKKLLLNNGLVDVGTLDDVEDNTVFENYRLELQEGDIVRMRFNNIFYEIDGIKEEPDYQHLYHKYVYQCYAKPRLIAGEELGVMQGITNNESIIQTHYDEIEEEADKIIF